MSATSEASAPTRETGAAESPPATPASTPTLPTGPLVGRFVRLDLAGPEDAEGLFTALDHDEVWAANYGGGPAARWRDPRQLAEALSGIAAARVTGGRACYTVRLVRDSDLGPAGRIVGTTSLGDADLHNERIHLGWTAYAPDVWASPVNPECKLLLLGHAFECGFGRVKIQTDAVNARSQAAIAKLGATREGVLRRHVRRADGTFRDTVVFSVLRDEWPQVRETLERRLAAFPS